MRNGQTSASRTTPNEPPGVKQPPMHAHRSLWPFLLPSGCVLAAVMLYPLGYGIYLSFFRYYLDAGASSFVGLANYADLLGEFRFWSALRRTFAIAGSAVGIEFCLGLLIAYGLYWLAYGAKTLNLLMFLPHIITPVVAALFLRWIFVGRWGLLDSVFAGFGLFSPDWLGDAAWARPVVVLADVWQFTPFMILVLFAGLNTVDQSQLEAAEIDGAGVWSLLWRIMLPAIRPLIVFVLAIRIMDAFRSFDQIYVLTSGGPGTATETLTMYTYLLAFRFLDIGKASALGVLTLLILAVLIGAIALAVTRRPAAVQ